MTSPAHKPMLVLLATLALLAATAFAATSAARPGLGHATALDLPAAGRPIAAQADHIEPRFASRTT